MDERNEWGSAGVGRESLAVPAAGQINGHLARREGGGRGHCGGEGGERLFNLRGRTVMEPRGGRMPAASA